MLTNVLEYKGFKATFALDTSVNSLHGRVFGIEDTIDFYGDSVEKLIREFHQSVDEYINWCHEEGQEPKKSWAGKMTLRPTDQQHEAYMVVAAANGVSLNKWMLETLDRASYQFLSSLTGCGGDIKVEKQKTDEKRTA
jgi:predicted HicB family RNase H-like nuclease